MIRAVRPNGPERSARNRTATANHLPDLGWSMDGLARRPYTESTMLTPEQTTALRARLQADLSRLADHAHSALDFTMDRDRDRIGRDSMDESTEEEIYSTQLRLHDRETFLLEKIREAMRRLEAGEIDECEECSEPIGFKRLMARPVTTLCFECKTAREQVEAEDNATE
jgi:DnaK suppressor protein